MSSQLVPTYRARTLSVQMPFREHTSTLHYFQPHSLASYREEPLRFEPQHEWLSPEVFRQRRQERERRWQKREREHLRNQREHFWITKKKRQEQAEWATREAHMKEFPARMGTFSHWVQRGPFKSLLMAESIAIQVRKRLEVLGFQRVSVGMWQLGNRRFLFSLMPYPHPASSQRYFMLEHK